MKKISNLAVIIECMYKRFYNLEIFNFNLLLISTILLKINITI